LKIYGKIERKISHIWIKLIIRARDEQKIKEKIIKEEPALIDISS
jgi:hypothetical protein